ncbi:MAG: DUF459 domain-containing protein, partial [Burkholderiales bacterium]|nr:DUF459 domain-containing protein [Burkholderiales bacterium]
MARMVQEVSVAGGIRRPPTSLGARLLAILAAMLAGAAVWAMATAPALSQDDTGATSYITPFPENDIYRLQVLGDWMAEGLLAALTEGFADDARLQLPKRQQTVAGLIRLEAQEFQGLEDAIAREPMHIAVMLFGVGDRIPLRGPGNRRVPIGSEEWRAEYGRRVDRLVRALKRRGAAVYLVSLPIVRRSDMNDDVQMLNEVFRERALLNNVKFIDVYEAFADESGSYNQYGPDLTGKIRLLRDGDGVGLTAVGSRKLAYFVEREIKRDLTQARNERTIPLAGAEAEQRRILPKPQ